MTWINWKTLAKSLLLVVAVVGTLFLLTYFSLKVGIEKGDITDFLKETALIWVGVRLVIYATSGYFLWRIYRFAKNEEEKTAYRKLMRAGIITAIVVECVIWFGRG